MNTSSKVSAQNLLAAVRDSFSNISDATQSSISLVDCLMSGLAIFGLKYASLLQFDNDRADEAVRHNLRQLYGVERVPCDTTMRERLDDVAPENLRKAFKKLFALIQRNKVLEPYAYIDGHYLVSIDGTGQYSSHAVHCSNCCVKTHKNGTKTYYHNMLAAALVHPDHKEVFPFVPEAITKQETNKKNDCEQRAAERLLSNLRREHPHLKIVVLEDALYATAPHINMLQELKMSFIIGAKHLEEDFNFINVEIHKHEIINEDGPKQEFKWANQIRLNGSNTWLKINLFDFKETTKDGKTCHFTWVTDLALNEDTVAKIAKAGRTRWRIENETFNTLKNQGYNFEHNYGHGNQFLSTNFSNLMLLAFFIDQIQQRCCYDFKLALEEAKRKLYFWEKLRFFALNFAVDSWEIIYGLISKKTTYKMVLDTC